MYCINQQFRDVMKSLTEFEIEIGGRLDFTKKNRKLVNATLTLGDERYNEPYNRDFEVVYHTHPKEEYKIGDPDLEKEFNEILGPIYPEGTEIEAVKYPPTTHDCLYVWWANIHHKLNKETPTQAEVVFTDTNDYVIYPDFDMVGSEVVRKLRDNNKDWLQQWIDGKLKEANEYDLTLEDLIHIKFPYTDKSVTYNKYIEDLKRIFKVKIYEYGPEENMCLNIVPVDPFRLPPWIVDDQGFNYRL